jgi:carbamoyltransferase
MNKRVRELSGVDDIFVQPAANDAGGSLGAACELSNEAGDGIDEMTHAYLGSGYDETEVTDVLDRLKIPYESVDGVAERTATLLREGALVGWFQGRMEGGPRALGNRSILADPRTVESRDNVNKYVKHREEWRPFAPSMLKEDAERFLKGDLTKSSYFMIDTYDTTSEAHSKIPAVLHPNDDTTRPQVVTEDRNKNYYNLLQSFKLKTGVGVVLNTSFNDSGEPIVRTPREAVQDFFAMGLDVLVLGDVVVSKDVHDSLPPELDESTEESIRAQGDS